MFPLPTEEQEDDTYYSHDDYVEMASDSPEEDEQSLDEHYKHFTDLALQQSSFGTGQTLEMQHSSIRIVFC